MDNSTIKTSFDKYLENQPEKYAIREVYFCHIGNSNCTNKVIDDVEYQDELRKSEN